MGRMPKPFTVEDLYLHQKITELDCSADPPVAACTVRSVDREADSYRSCIWAYALDGSDKRQLTPGPGHDKSPRWSPQADRLAFLPDRGGSSQLYLLPRDGGEAQQLGEFPGAVSDLRWAPCGRSLVVATAVPMRAPRRLVKAASRMAWRGVSTLVDTTVAMAFAVSWNPLMNSKASAAMKTQMNSVSMTQA